MTRKPDFLIIGAARSGTTALYAALRQVPGIFMPSQKEPHYFTSQWESTSQAEYLELFRDAGAQDVVGEASVSYTYPGYPATVARIAAVNDRCKFVYLMRQPSERAYSHYLYYRDYAATETDVPELALVPGSIYFEASNYLRWMDTYEHAFGSAQVLPVLFEDLVRSPAQTLIAIIEFLGVDVPATLPMVAATNSSATFRSPQIHSIFKRLSLSKSRRYLERYLSPKLNVSARNAARRLVTNRKPPTPLSPGLRAELDAHFTPMVMSLGGRLDRDLTTEWRMP
jgi:hypothetical protein